MLFMIPLPALYEFYFRFIFDSCSMTYLGLKTRGQIMIYLDASFDVNIKPIFRWNVLDSMVPMSDFQHIMFT